MTTKENPKLFGKKFKKNFSVSPSKHLKILAKYGENIPALEDAINNFHVSLFDFDEVYFFINGVLPRDSEFFSYYGELVRHGFWGLPITKDKTLIEN
jgi:hypothetical protein